MKGHQKSNAISIMAFMYSTLWWPLYSLFSYCFTLSRLEVMSRCCNNLSYIFIYTCFHCQAWKSKTNGLSNSKTSHQGCLPLRHYCEMFLLMLLAFDVPFSDYLVKWLTHLLVKLKSCWSSPNDWNKSHIPGQSALWAIALCSSPKHFLTVW